VVAQSLQSLIAECLELEVLELAALDSSFDVVVVVKVFVFNTKLTVLELDDQRVAFEAHVAQVALHDC
jgi:hypothetical protein